MKHLTNTFRSRWSRYLTLLALLGSLAYLAPLLSTLLLVLAVIAYFLIDVTVTTNSNIEKNKELVIEQTAMNLTEISENINSLLSSPATVEIFNQDFVNAFLKEKDYDLFNELAGKIALGFYPIDYIGLIRDGKLVYYNTRAGLDVDPRDVLMVGDRAMPLAAPAGAAALALGDFVEQCRQVGAVEYVVDPPVGALFSVDHRR